MRTSGRRAVRVRAASAPQAGRGRDPGADSGLPYGVVMATGAGSHVADAAGIPWLRLPLLWIAVALAVVIAVAGAARILTGRLAPRDGMRVVRFGALSIPIGLAVIAGGLAGVGGIAVYPAAAVAVLSWVTMAVLAPWSAVAVSRHLPESGGVDETWFLLPAAPLAGAIAAVDVGAEVPDGLRAALDWFALGAAAAGTAAYGVVAVAAVASMTTRKAAFRPAVAWWIAAGCAGLAAAAVGQAAAAPAIAAAVDGTWAVQWSVWMLVVASSILLVPIIAVSAAYLARRRRVSARAPWPPTFSTGVYALGLGQADRLAHGAAAHGWYRTAAVATLVLWVCTSAAHVYGRLGPGTLSAWINGCGRRTSE